MKGTIQCPNCNHHINLSLKATKYTIPRIEQVGNLEVLFTIHFLNNRNKRCPEIMLDRIKDSILSNEDNIKFGGQYAIKMWGHKQVLYLILSRQEQENQNEVVVKTISYSRSKGLKALKNNEHIKILEEH